MRFWYWFGCGREIRVGHGNFADGKGELLLGLAVAVVSSNDALDELVANDVDIFKVAETNAFYAVEDVKGFEEAGLLGGWADLFG